MVESRDCSLWLLCILLPPEKRETRKRQSANRIEPPNHKSPNTKYWYQMWNNVKCESTVPTSHTNTDTNFSMYPVSLILAPCSKSTFYFRNKQYWDWTFSSKFLNGSLHQKWKIDASFGKTLYSLLQEEVIAVPTYSVDCFRGRFIECPFFDEKTGRQILTRFAWNTLLFRTKAVFFFFHSKLFL